MLDGPMIIMIIVWLYALSVAKRARFRSLYFWIGCLGLFFILLYAFRTYYVWFFSALLTNIVGFFGHLGNAFTTSPVYGLINIACRNGGNVILHVDYECSGVVEKTAYIALLAFYPLYDRHERMAWMAKGLILILLANSFRLLFICFNVYWFGPNSMFLFHSIIGRIIFYLCVVAIYYQVFTKPQIQKVRQDDFSFQGK